MIKWVAVVVAVAACGKKGPSRDDARAAYTERRDKVAAIENVVRAELAALALPVDTPEAVSAAATKLHEIQGALQDKLTKAVDDAGARGLELEFRLGLDRTRFLGSADVGSCDLDGVVGKNENVKYTEPEAISADDRRIGYGLYDTAYEKAGVKHGDGTWHPGINVRSELQGPIAVNLMTCFLTDGTPRPE